ncbi:DUF402 domain-containing protein [Neobacillus piezotolerans]|uniref:DUF402 domain-containing protein n=1 Tax=Neobacillus piezotolerans TaxID=2259171 RepID=A0A3D8GUG2_9BACI|nr:DUF402 domain-containing protein [Neobacillus piezotolerans]RDU38002.1 DUF402 domain-containing protein [Neobacillus piezotolerans]
MHKRVFGNRPGWKRITKRRYSQSYLVTQEFKGYISLLHTVEVASPLFVEYKTGRICIVDSGYFWLQQFPEGQNHSVTTMFDCSGEVVQWYIDICIQNSAENGVPFYDDLYLDLVVFPSGEVILKDADELDEALSIGLINTDQYNLAWTEAEKLKRLLANGDFPLLKLSCVHRDLLLETMG